MKRIMLMLIVIAIFPFILFAKWVPGENIVDKRDNQEYKTVVIGNQVWMAENLNYGSMIKSINGQKGHMMSDNDIAEKYCWNNDSTNCNGEEGVLKRGGFYEWEEAVQYWDGQPELPVRGICPEGWHIPSTAELNELINYCGGNSAYQKLLEGGDSGFDAVLTGYRCTMNGGFRDAATASDTRTYYWTSEQTDTSNAPFIEIGANSITGFSFLKSVGLCIRCIWDGNETDIKETFDMNEPYLDINIRPNPAQNDVTIHFYVDDNTSDNVSLRLYDNLGNLIDEIYKGPAFNGFSQLKYNVSSIPSGVYSLVITNKGFSHTERLIIIN